MNILDLHTIQLEQRQIIRIYIHIENISQESPVHKGFIGVRAASCQVLWPHR